MIRTSVMKKLTKSSILIVSLGSECTSGTDQVPTLDTLNIPPSSFSTGPICKPASFFISNLPNSYIIHALLFPNVEIHTANLSLPPYNKHSFVHFGKELKSDTNAPSLKQPFTKIKAKHPKRATGFAISRTETQIFAMGVRHSAHAPFCS